MNILITVIAVGILIVGVFLNRKTSQPANQKDQVVETQTQEEILSFSGENDEGIGLTPSLGPTTAAKKVAPTRQNSNLYDFLYPQSTIIAQSNTKLELESFEDVDEITNWYKEKIRKLGFNVKSFVITKTNENVLNKLSGAGPDGEVNIELKEVPEDLMTKITIIFE